MSRLDITPATRSDLAELELAARADGHSPIGPTHLARQHGKIVGCFSAVIPAIFFWSHTSNHARTTLELLQAMEASIPLCALAPCSFDSPLLPLMRRRKGYERIGTAELLFFNRHVNPPSN